MRKIIFILLLAFFMALQVPQAQASLISNRSYRSEQAREVKQDVKKIKHLFKIHNEYANKHDIKALSELYSDKYINNDGFDKTVYFKSIEATWKACEDISYTTKIQSISVNGDYAEVEVVETALGTVMENYEFMQIAGEIHSKSKGIYHLERSSDKWYISGETSLGDESSLLYGDARFMNIELQVPAQVEAGETYTATVKVDADENMFILGSIDRDSIVYPPKIPQNNLRALPKSQVLERVIKSNTDNLNEYAVVSLVMSNVKQTGPENLRAYMAGLACIMKRINVIPQNNFINSEE